MRNSAKINNPLFCSFVIESTKNLIYSQVILDTFSLFQPEQILRANCRTLRAFISLVNNSTKQLKRFQAAEELVTSKLVDLKLQAKSLITYLRRIVQVIKFVSISVSWAFPAGRMVKRNENKLIISDDTFPMNMLFTRI